MADQTITPKVGTINTLAELATGDWEDLTTSNQGILTPPKDGKFAILTIGTAGTEKLTIKAGLGSPCYNQGDYETAALGANLTNFIVIESARFKALSGTDKGKIRFTASANLKVAAIQLP